MALKAIHNDKILLLQIARGNEQAFRQLFDQYNKLLFTFVEQLTKSAADAEEIVQQCFVKLWINRRQLQHIDNPGSYLYAMARNRTVDHIRKVSRDRQLQQMAWANMQQADHSLEESLRTREYQQIVAQALAALPEQKQKIYLLSREQGLSHDEIARVLGLSRSRVNNVLVETLRFIKQSLEQHTISLAILFLAPFWHPLL